MLVLSFYRVCSFSQFTGWVRSLILPGGFGLSLFPYSRGLLRRVRHAKAMRIISHFSTWAVHAGSRSRQTVECSRARQKTCCRATVESYRLFHLAGSSTAELIQYNTIFVYYELTKHISKEVLGLIHTAPPARWCNGKAFGLAISRPRVQILLEATLRNNLGQVVYTYVPLSPSSITWYRPQGGDALRLGR